MSSEFDMDEILVLFLEESFEGLDVMEQGLLDLDIGQVDLDVINNIFRAAHSIKGGAGTLGFMDISHFTHGVETLLDEIRSGKRVTTADNVQVLLQSVDHLRGMLNAMRDRQPIDEATTATLESEIKRMLGQADPVEAEAGDPGAVPAAGARMSEGLSCFRIGFLPKAQFFSKGNDPLAIFSEMQRLGSATITARTNRLPIGDLFDPERCYLEWDIELRGDITREQVEELFAWVTDECTLKIESVADIAATESGSADAVPVTKATTVSLPESPAHDDAEPAQALAGKAASPETETAVAAPKVATQVKAPAPDHAASTAAKAGNKQAESASIRVSTEKIDTLLNLVGELVITQSMLRRFGNFDDTLDINELRDGLIQLERHTRELQESVMQIRMLPISFCFSRFPRLVHDLSAKLGKKIDLKIEGQSTELDKTVLEKIGDPLVHLVRNSLDHGIESAEVRRAAGKPETGTITLSASHQGGNVVIQVIDDGAGINKEKVLAKARSKGIVGADEVLSDDRIFQLIFAAGFSTADVVSDVSGRGVGMDVVKRNIQDLGGRVEIASESGKGSTFTIRLPLTLAILDGQLVRVAGTTYVISLLSILETIQVQAEEINVVPGHGKYYSMRDRYIPVVSLAEQFGIRAPEAEARGGLLVVLEVAGQQFGLFVDELLDQQQVVIKSLEENYRQIEGLAGATILGDGSVALILDAQGLAPKAGSDIRQPSKAA